MQRTGLVHIEEDYGPFDSPSKHNPCMRSRWGPLCKSWGFVIARYNESKLAPLCTPDAQDARIASIAASVAERTARIEAKSHSRAKSAKPALV